MLTKTYKFGNITINEYKNTEFEIPDGFELRPITTRECVNGKVVTKTIKLLRPIERRESRELAE